MTTTYRDIVVQEAYRDNARTYNVCANGEGENPLDVAHELDQEWQEQTWAEVEHKRAIMARITKIVGSLTRRSGYPVQRLDMTEHSRDYAEWCHQEV